MQFSVSILLAAAITLTEYAAAQTVSTYDLEGCQGDFVPFNPDPTTNACWNVQTAQSIWVQSVGLGLC